MRWWMIAGGLGGAAGVLYLVHRNSGPTVAAKLSVAPAPPAPVPAPPVDASAVAVTPNAAEPAPEDDAAEADEADEADTAVDDEIDEELLRAAAEEELAQDEALQAQEPEVTSSAADEWSWPDDGAPVAPTQLPGTAPGPSSVKTKPKRPKSKAKPKAPSPTQTQAPAPKKRLTRSLGSLTDLGQMTETNSIAAVPGIKSMDKSSLRALLQTVQAYGGNVDRMAAVISRRSKFNPGFIGNLKESGKTGYGLMGWPHPVSATAKDQIVVDLANTLQKHPWLASDPALIVLQPWMDQGWIKQGAFAGRSDGVLVVEQPYVDIAAHAPTQAEAMWPRLGNWDTDGDGRVTVGEIRNYFYDLLNGVGRVRA